MASQLPEECSNACEQVCTFYSLPQPRQGQQNLTLCSKLDDYDQDSRSHGCQETAFWRLFQSQKCRKERSCTVREYSVSKIETTSYQIKDDTTADGDEYDGRSVIFSYRCVTLEIFRNLVRNSKRPIFPWKNE